MPCSFTIRCIGSITNSISEIKCHVFRRLALTAILRAFVHYRPRAENKCDGLLAGAKKQGKKAASHSERKGAEWRGYMLRCNMTSPKGTPKPSPHGAPRFHRLRPTAPAGASAPRKTTPTEGRSALYGTLTNRAPVGCAPEPCRIVNPSPPR